MNRRRSPVDMEHGLSGGLPRLEPRLESSNSREEGCVGFGSFSFRIGRDGLFPFFSDLTGDMDY